jgi:hypothetical protein
MTGVLGLIASSFISLLSFPFSIRLLFSNGMELRELDGVWKGKMGCEK